METEQRAVVDDPEINALFRHIVDSIHVSAGGGAAEGASTGAREEASDPAEAGRAPPDTAPEPLNYTDGEKAILSGYVALIQQCTQLMEKITEVNA